MTGDLAARHDVHETDESGRIDHESDAGRVGSETIHRWPDSPVSGCRGVIGVGQQPETESHIFVPGPVLRRMVIGGPEDDHILGFEFRGSITEPLGLARSAFGGRLRVPPHNHPPAPEVRQTDFLPFLVHEDELGRGTVRQQHPRNRTQPDNCRLADSRSCGIHPSTDSPKARGAREHELTTASASELTDAKDDAVKAELRADIANALLTIERRIAASTYWILSVVVATVGIAAGVVIAVLK